MGSTIRTTYLLGRSSAADKGCAEVHDSQVMNQVSPTQELVSLSKCNISEQFVKFFLEFSLKCRYCNIGTTAISNVSGYVTDLPRTSILRVTTQAQENHMRTQHLSDRKRTAAQAAFIYRCSGHDGALTPHFHYGHWAMGHLYLPWPSG